MSARWFGRSKRSAGGRCNVVPKCIAPGRVAYLCLLILLVLVAGGCSPQSPALAQAGIDAEFTLKTKFEDGRMVFVGAGGEIDGLINPDLVAQRGDRVRVIVLNEDGIPHDFAIDALGAHTPLVTTKGQSVVTIFEASKTGEFEYYCAVSGHRQMGMEGTLIVSGP